jgi:hypothetical protein
LSFLIITKSLAILYLDDGMRRANVTAVIGQASAAASQTALAIAHLQDERIIDRRASDF